MPLVPDGRDAAQIGLALAIGLLVGFEREWSNKDAGIRTCALTALLGMLAAHIAPGFAIAGLAGVLVLVAFINLQALRARQAVEITTSAALIVVYALGVLVGNDVYFLPGAAAILATLLLAWKLELHRFAGDLRSEEIRSAIWLGLLAFVVYPLLPNRAVDRWALLNPHTVWVAVIVVAAVGFGNYVLMRLYSARGLYYGAVLGGMVSGAATVLELGASLRELGAEATTTSVTITLLVTLAMCGRNLLLLAIFVPAGLRVAGLPLLAMAGLAAVLVVWRRHASPPVVEGLKLRSPISLRRVAEFGAVFLVIEVLTALAQRQWGHYGIYAVSVLGGAFNSAGAIAAVGELAVHGTMTARAAGIAAVLASMAATVVKPPLMSRVLARPGGGWLNTVFAWAVVAAGAAALALGAARW